MGDPESAFSKNHLAGPIYSIFYRKEGGPAMGAKVLLSGFLIDLLAAGIAACLLSSVGGCGCSYWCRVGFVMGLGVFVALVGHVSYWNWMSFPLDYTIAFVIDNVVGWTLAGLAIAAVIRPQTPASVATVPAPQVKPQAPPRSAAPPQPARNDAINLLAALQREARFVDLVKEPLGDYSDAQVGAAARDVLRDCGVVLDRLFQLEPVFDNEEGATVEVPGGLDAGSYRITGNAAGESPTSGTLAHHGWRAKRCELPKWSGSKNAALVVAPAEVDVK
jgi:hypothetical protein